MVIKIRAFFVRLVSFVRKNLNLIIAVLFIILSTLIYKTIGIAMVAVNTKILENYNLAYGGTIIFLYTFTLALLTLKVFFSKNKKILDWFKKILVKNRSLNKKEKNKKGKEERIVLVGLFITLPAFFLIYTKELGFEIKSHILFLLFLLSNFATTLLAICTALFLKDYPISFLLFFFILIFFIIRKKVLEKMNDRPV